MKDINTLVSLVELGSMASEWLEQVDTVRKLKIEYKEQRDLFIQSYPGREWKSYLNDPAFILCTRKSYLDYDRARATLRNVERKLERRYLKLKREGLTQ